MPGFADGLTGEEIRAIVIYIRELEASGRDRGRDVGELPPDASVPTQYHAYRIETVARGLDIPWSMAFLPDGRMLVTERPGSLRIISADGQLRPDPVGNTPRAVHHKQGGMMEVCLHPDYQRNGWIYLGFADAADSAAGASPSVMTAIVRGRINDGEWVDEGWVFRLPQEFYSSSGVHFGCRIVFDDEDHLFFTLGERGSQQLAQRLDRPNGKVLRLHSDGRIPTDNPFVDRDGALGAIWSYGHRNPQGLVRDGRNGDIYATEHGPRGGDELNLIVRGANYGWPLVTHGMNYNGTPITGKTSAEGIQDPVLHWTPSIAACGLAVYSGEAFPHWRNDIFAGALKQKQIQRLRLVAGEVVEQEIIFEGMGRVRDVRCGPDGLIYVALNSPGMIIRLVPGK